MLKHRFPHLICILLAAFLCVLSACASGASETTESEMSVSENTARESSRSNEDYDMIRSGVGSEVSDGDIAGETETANTAETESETQQETVPPETETSAPAESETPAPTEPAYNGIDEAFVSRLNAASRFDRIMITSAPSSTSMSATFYYFERVNGQWTKILEVPAYIGSEGIGDADLYHSITPSGIYTFTVLFGIAPDPGCSMTYHQLTGSEYWCGGQYFNQFVDERYTDHSACTLEDDEYLAEHTIAYVYAAAFDYNSAGVYDEGSAFFLHCYSDHPWTEGCVAVPEDTMRYLLTRINGSTCLINDVESNLSNY